MRDPRLNRYISKYQKYLGFGTRFINGHWSVCPCCGAPHRRRIKRQVWMKAAKKSEKKRWKRDINED